MNHRVRWGVGVIALAGVVGLVLFRVAPPLLHAGLPHLGFFGRCFSVLLLCCFLCLWRIVRGPTAPDRAAAIDILGIMIVSFCALLSIPTGRGWYMDIGIAWALQSFIITTALAKYMEGKNLDE
ncbi:MAG: monovalent cation/H+ antiporter complex subunit F [Planctomycetota bacterium]